MIIVYIFKCLKNILTVNVKTTVYESLVQSIVFYGIAFYGNSSNPHIKKLLTTLNSLVKYIFYNSWVSSQQLLYTYNECKILNIKTSYFLCFFLLFLNILIQLYFLLVIATLVLLKILIGITLPKLKTVFCQSGPYFVFTKFCIKQKILIHDFVDFKQKLMSLDLHNICR